MDTDPCHARRNEDCRASRAPAGPAVAGFTLLEVLVALALLSVGLAMLLKAFAGGLANVRAGDGHVQAAALAEGVLAQAGTAWPLESGGRNGESGGYRWQLEIAPAPVAEATNGPTDALAPTGTAGALYTVSVTVRWREAGREARLRLSSLRARQER